MGKNRPEIRKIDFERLREVFQDQPVVLELISEFETSFAISKHIVAWFDMVGMSPIGWEPTNFEVRHEATDLPRMTMDLVNTGRAR